jgi:hypothetical protein
MLTKAQKHLLEKTEEQLNFAEEQINKINEHYHYIKTHHQFKHIIQPEVTEGLMESLGYWRGIMEICKFIKSMINLSDYEFDSYMMEQEKNRLMIKKTMEEGFDIDKENLK